MSRNTIQPIEDELSQRNDNLTEEEIQTLCNELNKPEKKSKFRRLLTGNVEKHRDPARWSLEGMIMFRTGDVELTAKVVAASDLTQEDIDIEALKSEIRYWDQYGGETGNGWDRRNNDSDNDDSGSNNGRSNGASSQNPRLNKSTAVGQFGEKVGENPLRNKSIR